MVALSLLAALLLQANPLAEARRHAARGELETAIELLQDSVDDLRSAPAYAFLSDLDARVNRLPQAARALSQALDLAPDQHRWRTTLGALYFQLGRLPDARQQLERAVRHWPQGALAHYYLANVLKAEGRLVPAEAHAERAVELLPLSSAQWMLDRLEHPPEVNARFLLADIRHESGRDAEDLLRQVLETEPLHAPALYLHFRILKEEGRPQDAAAELEKFRKVKKAERHVMNALNLRTNGDPGDDRRILEELGRAEKADPEHPVALYLSGRELLRRGRYEEADRYFERCARLSPRAIAQEVRRLPRRGEVLEAMAILEASSRALSSAPGYAYLSQLEAQSNRLPQAAHSLERALEIDPSQQRWRATLGSLLVQLGRLEEARVVLEKVVEAWPDGGLAHYTLGTVLKTEGHLARAEVHARRAVELLPLSSARWTLDRLEHPPPVNALFLLADVLAARGMPADALVRRVLDAAPVHAPARYLHARLLRARGDVAGAKAELQRFYAIKQADTHLQNALNYLYRSDTRDTERPLRELEQAVEAAPDHPKALYLLARELLRRGRAREARVYLEHGAALRPEAAAQWEPLLRQSETERSVSR